MKFEELSNNQKVELFLKSFDTSPSQQEENWPLNAAQLGAYFDVDLALGIYDRIKKLQKMGLSKIEVGKLFQTPTILRYFLRDNGLLGLKIANRLDFRKLGNKKITEYAVYLFDILASMVKNDPFCLDYKNLKLNDGQLNELFKKHYLLKINENTKSLAELNIDLFRLCWSLYYNPYAAAGFEIHGPYKLANGSKAIIRDYFDLNPRDIWKVNTGIKNVQIITMHEDIDFKLTYFNQPIGEGFKTGLLQYGIIVDNHNLKSDSEIQNLNKKIDSIAKILTNFVNSLEPLDQVRKGVEIAFYMNRKIFEYFKEDWKPTKIVNETIKKFGKSPIKKGFDLDKRKKEDWIKIFDPRIDYLGDILD